MKVKLGTNNVREVRLGNKQITGVGTIITDPDALAFIQAAQITNGTQKLAINYLVSGLKVNNLWNKMQIVYPFVGPTTSSMKWNLITPLDTNAANRLTYSGGVSTNSKGIQFDGINGYAQTYFFQDLTSGSFVGNTIRENFHFSLYSTTTASIGNNYAFGARISLGLAPTDQLMCLTYDGTQTQMGVGRIEGTSSNNGGGLFCTSVTSGSSTKYINDTAYTSSFQSVSNDYVASNRTPVLGAYQESTNNNAPIEFSNISMGTFTIGQYLSSVDVDNLNTIISEYNNILGRQV